MRALVQRLREAAWFADSEEHWGAIRAQIARENHHNILAVSLVFAVMMAIIPLFSPLSAKISAARQWYVIVMVCSLLVYVVVVVRGLKKTEAQMAVLEEALAEKQGSGKDDNPL